MCVCVCVYVGGVSGGGCVWGVCRGWVCVGGGCGGGVCVYIYIVKKTFKKKSIIRPRWFCTFFNVHLIH